MENETGDRRHPLESEVLKGLARIEYKVDVQGERLEEVIVTVHGTAVEDIDGNTHRTGGLVAELKRMRFDHDKSKVERLRPTDRAAIYVAAIGGVSMIVATIVAVVS